MKRCDVCGGPGPYYEATLRYGNGTEHREPYCLDCLFERISVMLINGEARLMNMVPADHAVVAVVVHRPGT